MLRYLPLLLILIAGCSHLRPQSESDLAWQNHQQQLKTLHSWQIQARIAINTAQESLIATLRWDQQRDHYTITLQGPLGRGSLAISGDSQWATLHGDPDTPPHPVAASSLLNEAMGTPLTPNDLRYWILGLPATNRYQHSIDSQGRLQQLNESGWTIDYAEYSSGHSPPLPRRIELTHPQARLRLAIQRWQLTP
jgi:outer membrane lipoprotein LolB